MSPPMRQKIKIGDVFRVSRGRIDRYFQFVAIDTTQMNSDVIRVFQKAYLPESLGDVEQIVRGAVDFYAHVFLKIGLKKKYWLKVGNSKETGDMNIYFRNSNDFGNPKIMISHDWHVWKLNEAFIRVGKLTGNYRFADIGVVVPPDSLVHRMQTGCYDFVYPDY